jgi:arsenite methyltransferase
MSAAPEPDTDALPPPPDLGGRFEQLVTDRQLKAGRALAQAMAIGEGDSVLELGSGTGLLSGHLADRVGMRGDVLGLDPSPYHMAIAYQRSRPNLRFQVGSPADLSRFPDGCFHAITAIGLLHTWPAPLSTLQALRRVLKPGGRLGLVTHAAQPLHPVALAAQAVLQRPPYAACPMPPEDADHAVSAPELVALLRQAGFADVQVEAQVDAMRYATPQAAIAHVDAASWGRFLRHLPSKPVDLRAAALAEIAVALSIARGPEGLVHEGLRLVAVAHQAESPPPPSPPHRLREEPP